MFGLKTIDRYIIKKFLGTFFLTIALIISIAVVFDIAEKMDDFLERKAPLEAIIFDYYLNFIPYYVNLFLFLFTFLSVVFFTSKMASRSEIVAILSSGVSFNRMLYPYFVSAAVIALLSFALSNYIIPPSTAIRLDFENTYLKNNYQFTDRNIHKQLEPGVVIYMEGYNTRADIGYKFSIEKFVDGKLKSKLISDYIRWDTITSKWTIYNYYIREIDGMTEKLTTGQSIDTTLKIFPEEFKRRKENYAETLIGPKLDDYIEEQRMRGSENVKRFMIEKYKRFGGTGVHIGIGLLISFSYILFMQVSFQFAIDGSMSPLLAVWVPNIIFGVVALVLYRLAPK